jgi:hypothetical protein
LTSGLSDGLFFKKIGYTLKGFGMENVGMFFGHLKHFTAIWYILWPIGNLPRAK